MRSGSMIKSFAISIISVALCIQLMMLPHAVGLFTSLDKIDLTSNSAKHRTFVNVVGVVHTLKLVLTGVECGYPKINKQ
jgi:hypothetical protein